MSQSAKSTQKYSFEEFKIYYEFTEKVTDRRLATNTWNYGLCTGIVVSIAALAGWATSHIESRVIMLLAVVVLSGMGMLLCLLWTGQIRDFKELNAAKFEVLNMMAPALRFDDADTVISATPFAREWQILKSREATREVGGIRIIALRSSNAEFLVPFAFRWLFIFIALTTLAITVGNWNSLKASMLNFRDLPDPQIKDPSRP